MDNWLLLTKGTIILYAVTKIIAQPSKIPIFLLMLLIYLSVNILSYIVKKDCLKKLYVILSMIVLVMAFFAVNQLFILLLPINIYELLADDVLKKWLPLMLLFFGFALKTTTIFPEGILVCLFSFLVIFIAEQTLKRIEFLKRDQEVLRERNNSLDMKLSRELDYENQIKYLSQLEERNKIAQVIHDQIGHSLAGSLMQLEAAKLLMETDRHQAQALMGKVIGILREGMENLRVTLRSIKPAPEQMGINRLKLLCDSFAVNQTLKVALHYQGDLEIISYRHWKVICENVVEALTNSLKYSEATLIKVNLEVLHKYLKIEVKDNGLGATGVRKSLGITGIEERTESLGGKVIIDGSQGFSVITLLPIGEE